MSMTVFQTMVSAFKSPVATGTPFASGDPLASVRTYRHQRWASRRVSRAALSRGDTARRTALRDLADAAEWACLRSRFATNCEDRIVQEVFFHDEETCDG